MSALVRIELDSDSESDAGLNRHDIESELPSMKRRKREEEHGRSVLHVEQAKSWKEMLLQRRIHEYFDPDKGRRQTSAQYFDGNPLTPEDEEWWLKNRPPLPVKESRIRQRRDRPPCLSEVELGDEVFIFDGNKHMKGTVVRAESDSEGDSEEHRLKYNRVPVKVRGRSPEYTRFRRSKLRNRTVHLTNLPIGWKGRIRLCDSDSAKVKGKLLLSSPHHSSSLSKPFALHGEALKHFLRDPTISSAECAAVEASVREGWRTARDVWRWLFDEDDSDSASGEDYDGDYCVVCGEGGRLVECNAKGCVESVHEACLEVAPAESEAWYCQTCRQEAFLLNRTVQTRVEHGPGVHYLHKIFGKPQASWEPARPHVHFELPKLLAPPAEFGIGVIWGSSGSGKSLILERRFGHCRKDPEYWDEHKAIIDVVHADPKEALERLVAAAIESESDMLKPYHVLSEGQRMRARVAKALGSGVILDEFASCLDYTVVHSLCRGVSRFVREKQLSKVVVASCHPMVVEWIRPDWSYNTDTGIMRHYSQDQWPPRQLHSVSHAAEAILSKLALDTRKLSPKASSAEHEWVVVADSSEGSGDEMEATCAQRGRMPSVSPSDETSGIGLDADQETKVKPEHSELEPTQKRPAVTLKQLRARPRVCPHVQIDPSVLAIQMEVADPDVWEMFRTEHYKPGSDIKGAHVFVATLAQHGGTPVGMVAVRPQPGGTNKATTRAHHGWYRESRLVVLKVWQGIGIGCAISDAIAKAYRDAGCIYTSCFLHPRLYKHRHESKLWKATSNNMVGGLSCPTPGRTVHRSPKFSYEFIGDQGGGEQRAGDEHVLMIASSDEERDDQATEAMPQHEEQEEEEGQEEVEEEDDEEGGRGLGGGRPSSAHAVRVCERDILLEQDDSEESGARCIRQGGQSRRGRAPAGASCLGDERCVVDCCSSSGSDGESVCHVGRKSALR